MLRYVQLTSCLLFLLMVSCSGDKDDSTKKKAQKKKVETPIAIPLSTLQFPADFPLSDLALMINNALPKVLADSKVALGDGDKGDTLELKIERRGKLKLSSRGSKLYSSIPLNIEASVEKKVFGIKLSNKKKPIDFTVEVQMESDLKISQNWNLVPTCKITGLNWVKKPTIKILFANVNLEKIIENQVEKNHQAIEDMICKQLTASVPLRKQVVAIWEIINEPQVVARKPVYLWLNTQPDEFSAAFDKEVRDTLRVNIFTSSTVSISPDKPLRNSKKALPKNSGKTIEKNGLIIKAGFTVPVAILSSYLNDQLKGQTFNFRSLEVTVTKIVPNITDNQLHIAMTVKGDADATIIASGTPVLSEDLTLSISDFHYEVDSRNVLLTATNWAAENTLTEFVSTKANVPLKHILDSLDFKIAEALNQSPTGTKVHLDINFHSLKEDTLYMQPSRLNWFFDIVGDAVFTFQPTLIN